MTDPDGYEWWQRWALEHPVLAALVVVAIALVLLALVMLPGDVLRSYVKGL